MTSFAKGGESQVLRVGDAEIVDVHDPIKRLLVNSVLDASHVFYRRNMGASGTS